MVIRGERGGSAMYRDGQMESAVYAISSLSNGRTLWGCRACDWTHENGGEEVDHVCGSHKVTRAGDRLKSSLTALGITEERVGAVLGLIGLPGCGGCGKRQAWLNSLDEKLELGEKVNALKSMMGWK